MQAWDPIQREKAKTRREQFPDTIGDADIAVYASLLAMEPKIDAQLTGQQDCIASASNPDLKMQIPSFVGNAFEALPGLVVSLVSWGRPGCLSSQSCHLNHGIVLVSNNVAFLHKMDNLEFVDFLLRTGKVCKDM